MSKVPRSVGLPPLSDPSFEQALSVPLGGPSNNLMPLSLGEDDGKINPLAGMGLSDEQYTMILQNIVNGENFMGMGMDVGGVGVGIMQQESGKRGLDDAGDGRDGNGIPKGETCLHGSPNRRAQ